LPLTEPDTRGYAAIVAVFSRNADFCLIGAISV
jgi:hypothetical protein